MKKKTILLLGLMGVVLPLNAKALTGSVNLSCDKTTLKPSEVTTCKITGNINEEVSAVSMKVKLGDNLTISNIKTDSSWQGDGEDGNIELYTDTNKKGNFNIATFKVTASSITIGADTTVSLDDVALSDASFAETKFTVKPLNIRVASTVNTLSSLSVSGGTINFDASKNQYDVTIDADKTTISATKTDAKSTVVGVGEKILKYGLNTYEVKVTSESGVTRVYTLNITRPDNRDTSKELLKFKFVDNEINFDKDKFDYALTVQNDITRLFLSYGINKGDNKALYIDEDSISLNAYDVKMIFNSKEITYDDMDNLIEEECDKNDKCIYKVNDEVIGEYDPENPDNAYMKYQVGELKIGENKLEFVVVAENETTQTYTFTITRKDVEFIEAPTKFDVTKDKKLTFRIDKDFNLFDKVYVDGKEVDKKMYEAKSGSTVITFTDEYTKTLKDGEHTFKTTFTDGSFAETAFAVGQTISNPETGLFIGVGTVGLIGLISVGLYFLLKNKNVFPKA